MRILIAPDKFKGSLTASQVCDAAAEGLAKKYPYAEIIKLPLADGGEGTTRILTQYFGGKIVKVKVHGPLFEEVEAEYGTDNDSTAFIEMASASGLQLLSIDRRNPLETTTFGTGELIKHALKSGCNKIVLGIGGSATNDAGIGMAHALGYNFYNYENVLLEPVGKNLVRIDYIENGIENIHVTALCDVTNPLHGPNGASYVYGPQKGADEQAVELLDQGLRNFERVATKHFKKPVDFPGAGAGGGIAGGANVFFDLTIQSGIEYIIKTLNLPDEIAKADLIVTGEGKIDRQTLAGKVVASVARHASSLNKKTIALCGICELRENELKKIGVSEVISLTDPFTTPEQAMKNAAAIITQKTAF